LTIRTIVCETTSKGLRNIESLFKVWWIWTYSDLTVSSIICEALSEDLSDIWSLSIFSIFSNSNLAVLTVVCKTTLEYLLNCWTLVHVIHICVYHHLLISTIVNNCWLAWSSHDWGSVITNGDLVALSIVYNIAKIEFRSSNRHLISEW